MEIILDPRNEVIVAYEINGEELSMDHGYPIRLIIPGTTGIRNTKWLSKMRVNDEESKGIYQQRDYKIIKEDDYSKVNFSDYKPIFTDVINSAIVYPKGG